MGFSKPSISNAMKKLKAEGYVQIEDKGRIVLTEKGKALAEGTYEKHCVISHLLMDIGVSKETALADACRMEHVISPASFQKLAELYQKAHPNTEPTENERRFDAETDPAD